MKLPAIAAAWAVTLCAQQPQSPHAGFVYPAGGRQGTKLQATLGGQFLAGANAVYVSGTGVHCKITSHYKPLTPAEATRLRERMQELNTRRADAAKPVTDPSKKIVWTSADQMELAEIRDKLADFVRRPVNPAISETVTLEIAVDADAPPGARELRVGANNGLTNPIRFDVGQLPELSRNPAKLPPAYAVANGATPPVRVAAAAAAPPVEITLPVLLNGQMMPGTTDRYRFRASKGRHIVARVAARALIPYISDAVPGWFQATLAVRDANGRELGYSGGYRFHPDPVLEFAAPEDGEYTLEIHDSIFRGREDFVYRIAVGELPFVTGIFPLGGRSGRTPVEIRGWNLPAAGTVLGFSPKERGVRDVTIRRGEWNANAMPFSVDSLPEMLEKGVHDRDAKAQKLKLPVIVNGRIEREGQWDVYRFDGRAGQEIVAEVHARRLESPLDSILKLMDSSGRQIAWNDDFEDKGAAMLTHQADSRIAFRLPKKGAYYLRIGDTGQKGGPDFAYRLRIGAPQPDYELRVVPSSLNLRAGANVPVTVYALRRDGFTGAIDLSLKDAPQGFSMSGGSIPAGQDKVRFTLTAVGRREELPVELHLEGSAEIAGREVRHSAVPAEEMMQAFAYHHLVPQSQWMARVVGAAPARFPGVNTAKPVELPAGGTVTLKVPVPPRLVNQVVLSLNEPPDGVSIRQGPAARDGIAVTLEADPEKAKAGLRGNLIVDVFVEREAPGGQNARRRQPMGSLPAIPFEIVAPSRE